MYTRNGHPRFRAASLRIKGNRWKFPSGKTGECKSMELVVEEARFNGTDALIGRWTKFV